jgi:glycosyltransferase involved in cell wall biosynthesis
MDIFVLPSIIEGLPMVVLEAMASRKPVIASRVGAIPSVVTHGYSGLLIEPKAADLESAISRVLKDPVEAERFGQNGYARVARDFSSKAMTEGYTALYRQATHAR